MKRLVIKQEHIVTLPLTEDTTSQRSLAAGSNPYACPRVFSFVKGTGLRWTDPRPKEIYSLYEQDS